MPGVEARAHGNKANNAARIRRLDAPRPGRAVAVGTRSPLPTTGGAAANATAPAGPGPLSPEALRLPPARSHLDDACALGPLARTGPAQNEHDQRLHEMERAEPQSAGQRRAGLDQDVQELATTAAQHTTRL